MDAYSMCEREWGRVGICRGKGDGVGGSGLVIEWEEQERRRKEQDEEEVNRYRRGSKYDETRM